MNRRTGIALSLAFFLTLTGTSTAFADPSPMQIGTVAGIGSIGFKDGPLQQTAFRFPTRAAIGTDGTIFVADTQNQRIRAIHTDGSVTTVAGFTNQTNVYGAPTGGYQDGNAAAAMFNNPKGIAIDSNGDLYIADSGNGAIRKLSHTGIVSTLVKGLRHPSDLAFAPNGDLYVSETLAHRILRISASGQITVIAGPSTISDKEWIDGSFADGPGDQARFNEPSGIAFQPDGTLYVADTGNQRIRKVLLDGIVTTVAGSGTNKIDGTTYVEGGFHDGAALQAQFNFPSGICAAADGGLLIADTYNNRIRYLSPNGTVETIAGTGTHGRQNGHEGNAQFYHPSGILLQNDGSLLIVDQSNQLIRSISSYLNSTDLPKTDGFKVLLNHKQVPFAVKPRLIDDHLFVPIRSIGEFIGYTVTWNQLKQTVTLSKDGQSIFLTIGNQEMTFHEKNLQLDAAPFEEDGTTFVPLRSFANALGIRVNWLDNENTVLLRTPSL